MPASFDLIMTILTLDFVGADMQRVIKSDRLSWRITFVIAPTWLEFCTSNHQQTRYHRRNYGERLKIMLHNKWPYLINFLIFKDDLVILATVFCKPIENKDFLTAVLKS